MNGSHDRIKDKLDGIHVQYDKIQARQDKVQARKDGHVKVKVVVTIFKQAILKIDNYVKGKKFNQMVDMLVFFHFWHNFLSSMCAC